MHKGLCKINLLMFFSTIATAGDMGEIANTNKTTPFVIGEATVNHIAYQPEMINDVTSSQVSNIWGGRFGAGLTRKYRDQFSFTSEIGYGYYGRVRSSFTNNVNNNYYAIDGLDALVGLVYSLKDLDLFFKAGAMIENRRVKGSLNLSKAYTGDAISGQQSYNCNFTQVLPSFKTGGMYNINANFALSLAYFRVFGNNTSLMASNNAQSNPLTIVSYNNIYTQNPTLDSILFGIQYNFT